MQRLRARASSRRRASSSSSTRTRTRTLPPPGVAAARSRRSLDARLAALSRPDGERLSHARGRSAGRPEPDWILCGNGSDDILTIVTRAFVGEGELLRLPYPSYILYDAGRDFRGPAARKFASTTTGRCPADLPSRRRPEARLPAQPQQPLGHGDLTPSGFWNLPSVCPVRWWWTRLTSTLPTAIACDW